MTVAHGSPDRVDDGAEAARLRQRLAQLASLMEVSRLIGSSLDLDEVLNRVMHKAEEVTDAEASFILLFNDRTRKLEVEVAHGGVGVSLEELKKKVSLDLGQGIAGAVALSRTPELVLDVAADPRTFRVAEPIAGITFRSLMAAPLVAHDRLVGVAEVLNPRGGRRFTPADLELFAAFCQQAAVAIENARLHRALLERERETQQLELAALVQQSFLPRHPPPAGDHGFAIEARMVPAAVVAGDLYDVVERQGDGLLVLIGDVSGKGFPAALLMAKVISDFRAVAHRAASPDAILRHLNAGLAGHSPRGMFVTAACLALDTEAGRVGYASAGHLPLLWYRRAPGAVEPYEGSAGPPLGILPGMHFPRHELVLGAGDALLLYTDGVVEARGAERDQFGLGRLTAVMQARLPETEDLVGDVLEAVRAHAGEIPLQDDVTLLALRWRQRSSPRHA